jgi:gamma-glutamylcyclotransferase (GGCT)/AIG2-like uncharacterized protein YtfP
MESKHLIFVYGTLRLGHSNHHLLKDANSYGIGNTAEAYSMYLISGYPYVTSFEPRYSIVGELYAINSGTLSVLDKMEGHPRHYERREVSVIVGENQFTAWMYFKDPPGVLVPNGDFSKTAYGKNR